MSSYGAFEPEDAEAATPVSPLVRATQPRPPAENPEAKVTHKRALAKVGGLILFATAATAVFMGGTGSELAFEQPEALNGGSSAVVATGLKHQQTSGVAYDAEASPFLDAATGTVMEVSAETTAAALVMDLAAAGAEVKTGDRSGTSHSKSWQGNQGQSASVDSHSDSCGKGCTEYDDDDESTPTPTTPPSVAPSLSPTGEPTFEPSSSSPSMSPTAEPTADSTSAPSLAPTADSTSTPSLAPSLAPTAEPTASPTNEATVPSVPPSPSPSTEPTNTFEPTKYYELESEYDDDNLYRLVCADFDDDNVYPSYFCNYGDSKTCEEKVTTSENYNAYCGSTCNKREERRVENGVTKTSDYSNSSWAVVCGWEAIKHMNETCAGTFEPTLKEATSADMYPNYTFSTAPKDAEVDSEKYDACNLHAFCSVCSYDSGTKIHKNCKAHVDKYGTGALYEVTSFFNSLDDFWCTDDVQGAIEEGTFEKTYGSS